MDRPERGTKCVCGSCNERFYDLRRTPVFCPKCGAEYTAPKAKMVRSFRGNVESRPRAAKAEGTPVDDVVIVDEDDEVPVEAEDDDDDADVVAIDPDRDKTPD